ncbi:MAG: peptide-methionine (S)-S-oxide reductase MsrA [Salinibacter sp.]|uniref:peptide-methionine (S)-S-oxide reductase MsrA n=1 Tax=Salinibacter sp. TaxID=2065818 RepID=UPI0035D4CE67
MSVTTLETDVPPMDRAVPTDTVHTAFALGCFWRPDALFGALDGVVRTCVGYAGGTTPDPTYDDIGDHIETVRVEYDPERIAYDDLLDHFWAAHDPTRAPFKRQYQPALFPYTDEQARRARETRETVAARHDEGIATELIETPPFYRAEAYHQKHKLRRHEPLAEVFQSVYPDEKAFTDSPAAALVNGYVGGRRAPERLEEDRTRLGLPDAIIEELRRIAEQRYAA